MATRKIVNKHINESSSTYVGVDGELFYDTVTNTLKISDGTTPGGTTLTTDGGPAADPEQDFTIKTSNFNTAAGQRYGVDTTSNTVTATLPASPSTGDAMYFADAGGAYSSNNLTVARNGNTIMGSASNLTVSTNNESFGLFYNGSTWRIY
jgi:hypothetical protein